MSNTSSSEEPTVVNALKTVKLEDFKDVPKIPCARNAFLYGMGAGVSVGAVRFLAKRSIPTAANWAVAAFCGVAAVSFEMCQMERKQKLEKLRMIIKATDSNGQSRAGDRPLIVDQSGKRGAFHVMVETPPSSDKKDE
ncbi:uncharacterized protein BYT42DRAFT_150499 [Radiomyces spectabilis]|uniref:uncharacterized protein n=1 Tax=Radiomyces spectabilis TaxID=64574 RepID=UPI002220DE31|nr:uncharacterized protein BYT42DRAFT_150499 [Radiomyces spectabilis]KAI8366014.1 hypothetical protein BYT42DRAFT_150499 [Radiomyces spectabilis]